MVKRVPHNPSSTSPSLLLNTPYLCPQLGIRPAGLMRQGLSVSCGPTEPPHHGTPQPPPPPPPLAKWVFTLLSQLRCHFLSERFPCPANPHVCGWRSSIFPPKGSVVFTPWCNSVNLPFCLSDLKSLRAMRVLLPFAVTFPTPCSTVCTLEDTWSIVTEGYSCPYDFWYFFSIAQSYPFSLYILCCSLRTSKWLIFSPTPSWHLILPSGRPPSPCPLTRSEPSLNPTV